MRAQSLKKRFLFVFLLLNLQYFCSPELKVVDSKPKNSPNLLWIVIDSLRGDVIGRYGVTPVLDEFSKSAFVFENHLVNAAWTRPSTLVFFTGKYASRSPVNFWDYPTPKNEASAFYQKELFPLPKYLSQNGIRTVMVGNNPFLTDKKGLGVNVGFEEIYDFSEHNNDTNKITTKTLEVLNGLKNNQKPFFFFLNYNDPHKPYTPPPGYTERIITSEILEERKRDYLGEVGFIDDQLGTVFDYLKKNGLWDNTIILITADHGEVMRPEHAISPFTGTNTYYGHGQDLFLENIHVPLLMKRNDQKLGKIIQERTQSIDLYPTVIESFQLEAKTSLDGISLSRVIEGQSDVNRLYYGETRSTQGIGIGNDFLLQKSFRFHELGKFWEGVVGREIFYYYNISTDPNQVSPIRFTELMELSDGKITDAKFKKISQLWNKLREVEPSIPIYTIRVNQKEKEDKKLTIQVSIDIGQIRLKKMPVSQDIELESSARTLIIRLNSSSLKTNDLFEISLEIYPDVTFPRFQFYEEGIDVTNSSVGIGMFDLAADSCNLNCLDLYDAPLGKPKVSVFNRFQVWQSGRKTNTYLRDTHLETDAMDILRKQGYVQ